MATEVTAEALPAKLIPKSIQFTFPKEDVDRMYTLMKAERLPTTEAIPGADWDLGVDLSWLQEQKGLFEREFKWDDVQKDINKLHHFTVEIEGVDLHFVHEPSTKPNAVPLLLLHGWPGTFFDFKKVIEPLTNPTEDGALAFHVVIPSLPGFGLSSYPSRFEFTLVDYARIFDYLMTTVLGYKHYVGQGGDWGAWILRVIGSSHAASCRLAHFNMSHLPPAGAVSTVFKSKFVPDFIKKLFRQAGYTEAERKMIQRQKQFMETGGGYRELQRTKPSTIGYAIGSSPLGLLSYIGEKFYSWSDPTHLDTRDLHASVAIYFLTQSFHSSVVIYQQSDKLVWQMAESNKVWRVRSRIGFSYFPYEIEASPRAWIRALGDLVFYREHNRGGHFPALDNPDALVVDLRDFVGGHWESA